MEEATYIPPNPLQMNQSLNNLEKYFHIKDVDALVQTAIIHAQFEMIHPFLDGNGRIGRLLIPLFMYTRWLLSYPSFYMSEYFSITKDNYYTTLNNISNKWDWNWRILFFLDAIIKQSNKNLWRIQNIITLYESVKKIIQDEAHTHHFEDIANFIFSKPVFKSQEFIRGAKIKKWSMHRYLQILEKQGILTTNSKLRNKTYYFEQLLDIIE